MAILTAATQRPVRWRRDLRVACFWAALALATVAVAREIIGHDALAVLALPAAFVAIRDLVRALGARTEGRLAERVARELNSALGPDYVVLTEYQPRDSAGVVPVVVVGPAGVFVVEPRAEDASFGCYRDGWHIIGAQGLHHLSESPSKRARVNAARVRSDISGGGHIRTAVGAFVLLERGRGEDCASSTVPVICGVDTLARELRSRAPKVEASPHRTRALTDALMRPLAVIA